MWLLTYWLFSNMLFSFHVFVCFSVFFLSLISSFIALWSKKKLEMILAFWSFLRLVLCPNMWPTLENIPSETCALEKYVYSSALGWNALKISKKYTCSNGSLKATISLLAFCLEVLSTEDNKVFKAPTVLLLVSPFVSILICSTCLGAPMLGV